MVIGPTLKTTASSILASLLASWGPYPTVQLSIYTDPVRDFRSAFSVEKLLAVPGRTVSSFFALRPGRKIQTGSVYTLLRKGFPVCVLGPKAPRRTRTYCLVTLLAAFLHSGLAGKPKQDRYIQ